MASGASLKLTGASSIFCSNLSRHKHNHACWRPRKFIKALLSAVLCALLWTEGQRYALWPAASTEDGRSDWLIGVILVVLPRTKAMQHARLLQIQGGG